MSKYPQKGIPTAVAPTTKQMNPKIATHVEYKGFTSLPAIVSQQHHLCRSHRWLHYTGDLKRKHKTTINKFYKQQQKTAEKPSNGRMVCCGKYWINILPILGRKLFVHATQKNRWVQVNRIFSVKSPFSPFSLVAYGNLLSKSRPATWSQAGALPLQPALSVELPRFILVF